MSNVVTLNLSNIKQLVDLNKDKVNFELDFQVESSEGVPFEALVVTQEMLDSESPLEYQKANGIISGKIVSDKNIYQNYFLILKSDTPVECKVMTNIKDIPANLEQPPPQQMRPPERRPQTNNLGMEKSPFLERREKKKNSWFTLRNLCFVILFLIAVFLIWYFCFYKKSDNNSKALTDGKSSDVPLISTSLLNNDELSDKISSKISEGIRDVKDGINSKISQLEEGLSTKVDVLDGKINANLSKKVDVLSNKIENELNNKVDVLSHKIEGNINAKVDNLGTSFSNKVDILSNKIEGNINSKVDGLGSTISDNLNAKVDGMKTSLSDNFNAKVDGMKTSLSDNFNAKVDGMKTSLSDNFNAKVDVLGSSITDNFSGKISEMKEEITDGLTSNIKNNMGEITNQLEKLKTQTKSNSGLKSESVLKKIKEFKISA